MKSFKEYTKTKRTKYKEYCKKGEIMECIKISKCLDITYPEFLYIYGSIINNYR